MKTCSCCSKTKPLSDFYNQRNKCKSCYNLFRKERYNKDELFRSKRASQIQQYKYQREKSNPIYNLKVRLSRRIRSTLVKQGRSKLLFEQYDIDVNSIYNHIGDRPSDHHHLDHILPVSAFDFTDPFQVWACNHQNNLTWLLSDLNLQKGDTYKQEDLTEYLLKMKIEWDASKA